MYLADPRGAFQANFTARRHQFLLGLLFLAAFLALVVTLGYFFVFHKDRSKVSVGVLQRHRTTMDRAEQVFEEAERQEQKQSYERALELYQEAEVTLNEVVRDPESNRLPEIRRRAETVQLRFSSKLASYQEWLEKNLERIQAERAFQKEVEEQRKLGRVLFHGGWIDPASAGLEREDFRGYLPEETALKQALAREDADRAQFVHALLRQSAAFEEKFYLNRRQWQLVTGPLPQPQPVGSGSRGDLYPEGVTVSHFPGIYWARIPFSTGESSVQNRMEWGPEGIRVHAVFFDSTAKAESATRPADASTLARNAQLVSSVVAGSFLLPCSRAHCDLLANLAGGDTPPRLMMIFRVKGLEARQQSREISHTLPNDARFLQTLTRHDYILALEVLHARWLQPLDGGPDLYHPLFPEDEPAEGLYALALQALRKGMTGTNGQ